MLYGATASSTRSGINTVTRLGASQSRIGLPKITGRIHLQLHPIGSIRFSLANHEQSGMTLLSGSSQYSRNKKPFGSMLPVDKTDIRTVETYNKKHDPKGFFILRYVHGFIKSVCLIYHTVYYFGKHMYYIL